jgi:hypothetical protein
MLYTAYEWKRRLTAPARISSQSLDRTLETLPAPVAGLPVSRQIRAACQIVAASRPTHIRPDWGIDSVLVGGEEAGVTVRPVLSTPFATLLHVDEPSVGDQPRTLVVAPISGHSATLLRPTVRTLLADRDVYLLDWQNARDVPRSDGRFGLDEYIDHVMQTPSTPRPPQPRPGGVPAGAAGPRRRGAAGIGRRCRPTPQPHAHRRSDRHAGQPQPDRQEGRPPSAVVLRPVHDFPGARPSPRRSVWCRRRRGHGPEQRSSSVSTSSIRKTSMPASGRAPC